MLLIELSEARLDNTTAKEDGVRHDCRAENAAR